MSVYVGLRTLALSLVVASSIAAHAQELPDTSWRLYEIVSMNGTVDKPDDPSKYTLKLQPEGRAAIRADCNRGTGSWTSESVGQIRFGAVASTRAMCPPGSLSEKYLAQFGSVRGYRLKDGHLFLATMADGSIIKFEPAGKVVATVLDEEIHGTDARQLRETILTRLFDRYASEKEIEVEPAEIDAFVDKLRARAAEDGLASEKDLSALEANDVAATRRSMAEAIIRQWKINKALYADLGGGRIIYQQLGPEPFDAYRRFIEERQRDGAFTIIDRSLADAFWRYFTDESIHDFMEPGSKDAMQAFTVPPWQRAK